MTPFQRFMAAVGSVMLMLLAIGVGTWAFIDGMPSWKTALLVVFEVLLVVLVVVSTLIAAYQYTRLVMESKTDIQRLPTSFNNDTWTPNNEDVVDGDFRPKPTAQKHIIRLPRFTTNGVSRPMLMPADTTEVVTTNEEGEEIKIELPILRRFCELETPSRSEWSGKKELYGEAMALCMAQGLLERTAKGGAVWKPEYELESRRAWVREMYNRPTRATRGQDAAGVGTR